MRLKAVIVDCLGREDLGREDLRRVVESLGVEGADRRSADSMRAAVGACRRATAESLLGCLGKDSLNAVCASVGVPAAGRREELIERILSGNGRPQTAVVQKRDGMMSEETAKPETPARLTAPQREARGMANGNGGKLDVPRLENWLWEAACVIRGPVDAPKFKDHILSWPATPTSRRPIPARPVCGKLTSARTSVRGLSFNGSARRVSTRPIRTARAPWRGRSCYGGRPRNRPPNLNRPCARKVEHATS